MNNFLTEIRRECFVLYAKGNTGVALEDIAVALNFDPTKAAEVADDFCRTEGLERPIGVIPVYSQCTLTAKQKQQESKNATKMANHGVKLPCLPCSSV
jgi:hypothetical protein